MDSLNLPVGATVSHISSLELSVAPLHCAEVLCYLAKRQLNLPKEVCLIVTPMYVTSLN